MNKNTITGLLVMGLILFGFSWYQNRQIAEQREKQQAAMQEQKALLEEVMVENAVDSFKRMESAAEVKTAQAAPATKTAESASTSAVPDSLVRKVTLSNEKLEIVFSSRGAQPYTVILKDFKAYGKDSLVLVKPNHSAYNVSLKGNGTLHTSNMLFDVVDSLTTENEVVMRLPVTEGYIQQKYTLVPDDYVVKNELSFHNLGGFLKRNESSFDISWQLTLPRLEKGYKNEKQYSKMNVCSPGSDPDVVGKGGSNDKENYTTQVHWFDFSQQFFSAIMACDNNFTGGDFSIAFGDEHDPNGNLMTCNARVGNAFGPDKGNSSYNYEFYFGPNDYNQLKSYERGYEKTITIGGRVIGLITRFVIIPVFQFLSRFIANYGLVILLLTLLIKLVISPLTIKSYMSSAKMNALRPEIDKLNEKYPKAAEDQKEAMKKQQATMELYRRAGVNPMGGCLPMLLQFPILWAMFRFFPVSIELRQQSFLWADDLSTYDSILDFGFSIFGMNHISLFALLMALSMFFYSKISMPETTDPQMKPMRFMSVWIMPIMMFFICNTLSAALSYYYLLSNLVTMAQTFVIKKWIVKPEKLYAQMAANKNKPVKKSRFMERLEQAQKMAEAQQRAAASGKKRK